MRGRHKRGSARPARPSRTAAVTRKLHKRLHTYRTFDAEQVGLNEKAPISGALQSPLTDSNRRPLLTMERFRSHWRAMANDCACLRASRIGVRPALCRTLPPRFSRSFPCMVDAGPGLRGTYDHRRVDTAGHCLQRPRPHGGDNVLVALVLDVPEPDLTPVENLLTPPSSA
jgi:hypothetical protein